MKLHPASVLYRAGSSVTRLAWVLVLGSLGSTQFGLQTTTVIWLVSAAFFLAFSYQLVYVRRFDYRLTADTFDIQSGVVSRRVREIPYRRVQNVDVSRNFLHRILGIAEVRVETAGGGDTEALLRYVSDWEAERLQREIGRLKRGDGRTDRSTGEGEELFAVSPKELALLGIIEVDLRLLSFVTALLPIFLPQVSEIFPLASLLTAAPVLFGAIVGVGLAVSSVLAVTNYYGFRLWRSNGELRYERGLIQRYNGSIPVDKVQSLNVTENFIARRLGYASLEVETAGYAPGEQHGSQSAVPLAERERVFSLAREIEPFREVAFERPPKRARLRYAIRYSIGVFVLAAAVFAVSYLTSFPLPIPWYGPLALLPLTPVGAHLKWRHLGYALLDDHVVMREGFWTRTTSVVPYYRIQTLVERATIFQRRRALATLIVDTAGSSGRGATDARAVDIDRTVATELQSELVNRFRTSLAAARRIRQRRVVDSSHSDPSSSSVAD